MMLISLVGSLFLSTEIMFGEPKQRAIAQPNECLPAPGSEVRNYPPLTYTDGKSVSNPHGPWRFSYQIVDGKGLILKDIALAISKTQSIKVFDSISVPHIKIEYGGTSKILRFSSSDCSGPLKITDIGGNRDRIEWSYMKSFNENQLIGTLFIKYDIVVKWGEVNTCEQENNPCFRFIPQVSYGWVNNVNPLTLTKFTAFYKIDYGQGKGLATIKDSDSAPGAVAKNAGRQSFTTQETSFTAVSNGNEGQFDNIHVVTPQYTTSQQTIKIPGCTETLFDCSHMHWRWGKIHEWNPFVSNIDVLRDPLDETQINALIGTPYLVSGQTIRIAVVQHHPSEDDPDDPFTLVNGEIIATATDGFVNCPRCILTAAQHPVVWYEASISNINQNTFFRHGIFTLNPTGKPFKCPETNTVTAGLSQSMGADSNICPLPPLPPIESNCDPNSPLLVRGSQGPKVTELQTYLTTLDPRYGALLGKPGIDGIFGQLTENAVKQYQTDKGLSVDGKVGPQTWGSICSSMNSLAIASQSQIGSLDQGGFAGDVGSSEQPLTQQGIAADNFTSQQQPSVDEFGNVIPSENATAVDNFTQPSPPPEAAMTAQVEICDNFVDDDGDGFVDFDDPESCVPAAAPEGNMTVQAPPSENVTAFDNFTAESEQQEQEQPSPLPPPTEPLVDEFGNVIPTESLPPENATVPSDTGDFAEDAFIQ